jgi:glycosyltransferase involved in cell wall biosynthesis
MSTVDIVVPCYNYARYLRGCVQSILNQSAVDLRVLIIDDASTDETAEVAADLAKANPAVEFHRHAVNKGHIATYNEGLLDWSSSDYAVLLSADDMLAPGALARATSIMDADTSVGMVYGSTIHFEREVDLPRVNVRDFSFSRWPGAEWLQGRCRAGHNVITSPEVVVRGSIQRAVGGYRPELPHAGDLEMWLRIAAVSDIAYVRGVPQAFYRVHPKSMMRTVYRGNLLDLQQRNEVFTAFFKHHRPLIADVDRLEEAARRSLAREALWDACRAFDRNDVDASNVEALEEFARNTYARATSLPEHSALNRRRRLGAAVCSSTQLFAAPAAVRSFRRWRLKQRWKRHGI